MCANYCCCCLNKNGILMSINTKSSHEDNKTLLDYYNFVFVVQIHTVEFDESDSICLRCSKALQVAYHFIKMVKDSEQKEKINIHNKNDATILDNSSIRTDIQPKCNKEQSPLKMNMAQNSYSLYFENQLKRRHLDMHEPNELNPLKLPNTSKTFTRETDADAGPSETNEKGNLDFKCIICNKFFEDKHSYYEHNKQHKEILPFKCKLCSFYTCYAESLFKHCEKNHGLNKADLDFYETKQRSTTANNPPDFEITHVCIQCNFKCGSQESIDEHLLDSHSIENDRESFVTKIYNCPSCHRSFMTLKSAKIHFTMYHICSYKNNNNTNNIRKFDCEKCGKVFDLKAGLFMHKRICEKREAVNCNFCNLKFTSVLYYERHLQEQHSVIIKHECEICGKTFSCSEYLTVHRKRHNERHFQCDLCSKNYINNAELKVHKQRIHAIKHTVLSCTICDKKFKHSALLKDHENREHNKRIYKCDKCGFSSHSSNAVKIHQFNHTGKPYKCQICPKEFAFRKVLRQHCEKYHSISLTNEEMAEMFKKTYGYTSRYDAFSKQNNSLEITEINELELDDELQEFGLTLEDVMNNLFDKDLKQ